jgi:hypothetical protein
VSFGRKALVRKNLTLAHSHTPSELARIKEISQLSSSPANPPHESKKFAIKAEQNAIIIFRLTTSFRARAEAAAGVKEKLLITRARGSGEKLVK